MKKCAYVGDYCEYCQYARWKTENILEVDLKLTWKYFLLGV